MISITKNTATITCDCCKTAQITATCVNSAEVVINLAESQDWDIDCDWCPNCVGEFDGTICEG